MTFIFALLLDADKIIEAVVKLLQLLFQTIGPVWTVIIAASFIILSVGWRIYNDLKKSKEVNLALEEKDKTISRLAAQERAWRIQFFKEKMGWTDKQIEKYIVQNDAPNIPAARKELEKDKKKLLR